MGEEGPIEQRAVPQGEHRLGILRGQFVVPDDFDALLPPEIQSYFEGDGKT